MTRIYALANQKGGVGKTTTAVNLAAYLAARSQRVLLIDVDPQANATSSVGVDKQESRPTVYELLIEQAALRDVVLYSSRLKMSIVPSGPALAGAEVELVSLLGREFRLQRALKPADGRYDYVIVDCPPSLGLLTLNGLTAAEDGVLVPVQAEYLALEGLGQLTQTLNRVRASLFPELKVRGVILTMYDGRTRLALDVVSEVKKHFPSQVFQSIIPRSIRLAEAPSFGMPISAYAPESNAAKAFAALARELLEQDGIRILVPA